MKKVSLQSIVSYLTETGALPEIKAEIEAELAKGEAKARLKSKPNWRRAKPRRRRIVTCMPKRLRLFSALCPIPL